LSFLIRSMVVSSVCKLCCK